MTSVAIRPRLDGAPVPAPAPSSFPLAAQFEARRADIEPLLPQGVSLSRVVAELYLAWRRNPDIAKVPVDLLIDAVCRALATEGVIDQDVYIVPFRNEKKGIHEAAVIVDYKYKVELVIAAGGARSIEVRAVWDQEPFEIHYGTDARITHQPLDYGARGKKLRGAYAIARIRSDIIKFEWMDIADVEAIRSKSKQWGPSKITQCPPWYAKKTVVHQLVKLLPKSPRLRAIGAMIHEEEASEFDLGRTPPADVAEDDMRMARVLEPGEQEPRDITDMVEEDESQLGEALATVVNKKPLGEYRNSGLVAIQEWAEKKEKEEEPDSPSAIHFAWIQRACQFILDARSEGTITEPARKGEEVTA